MLRLTELGLFLSPFAFYAAWLLLSTRVRAVVMWTIVAWAAAMAGGTIWYGQTAGRPPGTVYVPAHVEDGRIVPGHGVPARPE